MTCVYLGLGNPCAGLKDRIIACILITLIFVFIETISYSKLFHVRPVTQTDVYRADAKEIPRIFQVFNNKLMFIV